MSFGGGGSAPPPPAPPPPTTVPMRTLAEVQAPTSDGKVRSFMDPAAAAAFQGYGSTGQPLLSSSVDDINKRTVLGSQ